MDSGQIITVVLAIGFVIVMMYKFMASEEIEAEEDYIEAEKAETLSEHLERESEVLELAESAGCTVEEARTAMEELEEELSKKNHSAVLAIGYDYHPAAYPATHSV